MEPEVVENNEMGQNTEVENTITEKQPTTEDDTVITSEENTEGEIVKNLEENVTEPHEKNKQATKESLDKDLSNELPATRVNDETSVVLVDEKSSIVTPQSGAEETWVQSDQASIPKTENSEVSVVEEEEYEEEEIDEEGNAKIVLKKRVKVVTQAEKPIFNAAETTDTVEGEITAVEEDTEKAKPDEEEGTEEDDNVLEEGLKDKISKVLEKRRTAKSEMSAGEVDEEGIEHKKKRKEEKEKLEDGVDEIESKSSSIKSETSVPKSVESEEIEAELTEEELELQQLQEEYKAVAAEHRHNKFIDHFLQKRLFKYFKRKKMNHAISDAKASSDTERVYYKKLFDFERMQKERLEERSLTIAKWDKIKERNQAGKIHLKEILEEYYESQKRVGAKLVDKKTGKSISEKVLEDLLAHQVLLTEQMTQVRLCYVKLKINVNTKKAEIRIDHMGADFRLMDYEQLCIQKEDYGDRIIDRDLELKQTKQKAEDMQDFVDHMKRMSDTLEDKIETELFNINELDQLLSQARENLNIMKDKRRSLLEDTTRMKQASGLLTHPALLHDLEDTVLAVEKSVVQLRVLRKTFFNQERCIQHLRKALT